MLIYHLALHHAPKLGSQLYHHIIEQLREQNISIQSLFDQPSTLSELLLERQKNQSEAHKQSARQNTKQGTKQDKKQLNISHEQIKKLEHYLRTIDWSIHEKAIHWQESTNNHIITSSDSLYPGVLKQIHNNPPILYGIGDMALLQSIQLAIVGSRNPTHYGQQMAYDFANYLSNAGLTITSGMALGIDAASHQACLQHQGKTIAVTGTGLDRIYPAKHKELAHQIAAQGLLLSEFSLGTGPSKQNFPRRNQLISGLSVGTLVVEAALKSGSLITAHAALEQGREVFAIPGSIHNPLSRGCHQLIKQGAKLVETAQDIIDEISPLILSSATINAENVLKSQQQSSYSGQQKSSRTKSNTVITTPAATEKPSVSTAKTLIDYIEFQAMTIDEICQISQLSIEEVNSQLSLYELDGLIQRETDGKIVRVRI